MAWDFQTDPEFQVELDWMREFIDTEIIPLEPVLEEKSRAEIAPVLEVLRDKVKARGLWGRSSILLWVVRDSGS